MSLKDKREDLLEEVNRLRSEIEKTDRNLQKFRNMFNSIGDAAIFVDIEGIVRHMNRAGEALTGWTESEASGKPLGEILQIVSSTCEISVEDFFSSDVREKNRISLDGGSTPIVRDGGNIPVSIRGSVIFDEDDRMSGVVIMIRDETEEHLDRRVMKTRLDLIEYAANHSLDELLQRALDLLGELVDSPIGFYHFVDDDQEHLLLQQWSTRTLKEFCKVAGKGMHYAVADAGVWTDCIDVKKTIIHNDYASLPNKRGLPDGHAEIVREMVVPVIRENSVVAILGVGNKPSDYTQRDEEIVSYIADVTWEAVRNKRMEESVNQERDRANQYLEIAGIMFLALDAKGNVTLINRKGCEILEYEREEIVGKSWFDHFLPERIRNQMKTVFFELMAGKTIGVDSFENPVLVKGGREKIIAWQNSLIRDEKGTIIGTISSGEDITERVQAKKDRMRAEREWQITFDATRDAIWILDKDQRIIRCNIAVVALFGIPTEELIGKKCYELVHGTGKPIPECPMIRARESLGRETMELHYGKNWFRVSTDPIIDEDGCFSGGIHIITDITEMKEREQALRESEDRFKSIFDASRDAIFLVRKDAGFAHVNQAASDLTGYTKEELLSMSIPDLHEEDDLKAYNQFFKRIMAGEAIGTEADILRKDGTKIPTEFSNTRVEIGGVHYMHTTARDITDRRRAEEEKTKLEEQVHQAQRLESIGRLAGGVAHDLNNMLAPILGYGEMLLDDTSSNDPRREGLNQIVTAALRARDLIRQLLAFSRKQSLDFTVFNLNEILTNFSKLIRRTIREDIAITFDLASSLPNIKGDVGQLEQVIMNLAVNAQDAMPNGGLFTVTTEIVELDEQYMENHRGAKSGPHVVLTISDSGSGMDAVTQKHIFEPFFTTKPKDQGTGLGLATVYGIVKQHNGNIWVYSEPGLGTTFKIYFPVAREPGKIEKRQSIQPREVGGGSETILIVEDNEQMLHLAIAVLEREGYRVFSASSGNMALSFLEDYNGSLDLLLTDVIMPGLNGKELFERVSKRYPEMKVLYMSGYADDVIAHHGVMGEGVQFIQKPFTVKTLASKIREVLNRKS